MGISAANLFFDITDAYHAVIKSALNKQPESAEAVCMIFLELSNGGDSVLFIRAPWSLRSWTP